MIRTKKYRHSFLCTEYVRLKDRVIVFKNEKTFRDLGSGFLMTYTFKRKLMFANKSPRRIDRRSGARNKKIILKSYQKIIKGKKIPTVSGT